MAILDLAINKENAPVNSKNMVQDLWENSVGPSYVIMIDASTSVQVQSPAERLKNAREEQTKNPVSVPKTAP